MAERTRKMEDPQSAEEATEQGRRGMGTIGEGVMVQHEFEGLEYFLGYLNFSIHYLIN